MRASRTALVVGAFVLLACSPAYGLQSISSSRFQPAESCACHPEEYAQWASSMHALALSDPVFGVKLKEADEQTKGSVDAFCTGCHAPVAVMSGELKGVSASKLSTVSAEAISCDYCHQLTGHGRIANADQRVNANGVKRAQLKDALPAGAHKVAYSAYHASSAICGTCHNVNHPANGLPLESTYTEWLNSAYATKDVTCQDCHMTTGSPRNRPAPGRAAGTGPWRDAVFMMSFAGANVGQGNSDLALHNLRSAAKMYLSVPEILQAGKTATVTVTITNAGAGHMLPTGLTEFRQMWLEVTATDAHGSTTTIAKRVFGTVLKDAKGRHPAEVWNATGVYSDDRIAPLASTDTSVSFTMPSAGPVTIRAALYYRSATEEIAKAAGVDIPTVTMNSARTVLWTSMAEQQRGIAAASGPVTGDPGGAYTYMFWLVLLSFLAMILAVVLIRA